MRFWPISPRGCWGHSVLLTILKRHTVGLHEMLSIEHHSCDMGHSHLQFIPMPARFVPTDGAPPVFLSPWLHSKPVSPENTSEAFWSSCTWISDSNSYPHVAVFSSSLGNFPRECLIWDIWVQSGREENHLVAVYEEALHKWVCYNLY